MTSRPRPFPDAFIVLTGGQGRRLGGRDKSLIQLGSVDALSRAIDEVAPAPVIVVGPHAPESSRVRVTRESPPLGGPAAGLAAGVDALSTWTRDARPWRADTLVGIWAVDHVGVGADTWRRLAVAAAAGGGSVLIHEGRRQLGVSIARLDVLSAACRRRESWRGMPLRTLLADILITEVPAQSAEARDVDTLEDLRWWQGRFDGDDSATGRDGEAAVDEGTRR